MAGRVRILTILLLIALTLVACGEASSTATPATEANEETSQTPAQPPSGTGPAATDTPPPASPTPPYPEIDLDVALPYIQEGGAVPPGALTRIGIGHIYNVALYPDQSQILIGTSTGIYVYDLPGFDLVWRRYLERRSLGVSLSEDGSRVVTHYGWEAAPLLFDAATGNQIATLDGWYSPDWPPGGSLIAVEEKPGFDALDAPSTARIWLYDSATGRPVRALEAPINGFYGAVFTVTHWSPDGSYLAACGDEAIYIWDTKTANLLHTISASSTTEGLYLRFSGMGFSPNSRYLAIQDTQRLFVIDLTTGDTVFETGGSPKGFAWSPEGLFLAIQDAQRLFVIDLATGDTVFETSGDQQQLVWSPGGLFLMNETGVEAIDTNTWSRVYSVEMTITDSSDMALSPSDEQMAIATPDGVVVLNTDSFEVEYTLNLSARYVGWSPGGTWLIVGHKSRRDAPVAEPSTLTLFDGSSGEQAFGSLKPSGDILFVDEHNLLAKDGHRLMLVNLPAGRVVGGIRVGVSVDQMAWSEDGETLILSGAEGEWYWSQVAGLSATPPADRASGPAVTLAEDTWKMYEASSVSPDGEIRVQASNEVGCGDGPLGGGCGIWGGEFSIYEDGTVEPIVSVSSSTSGITAMVWSADGSMLALGQGSLHRALSANRVMVLDPRSGEELFVFEGHLGYVTGLIFSPDGTWLASAAEDGTVIVWNTTR
jgi:WD40 repeat protein